MIDTSSSSRPVQYWAVIPAGGVGTRMGAALPKQYLQLSGKTVIEHALTQLWAAGISGGVVAISETDRHWPELHLRFNKPLWVARAGAERCHSVRNALEVLAQHAADTDWVLVHDAARPCIRAEDIARLIAAASAHVAGGLLGVPVRDTMKRVDTAHQVIETVDRRALWHALTPQMFRLGALRQALAAAINEGALVTDEASAMELAGFSPLMVEGHADNIKITRPEDLPLAEFYLQQRSPQRGG